MLSGWNEERRLLLAYVGSDGGALATTSALHAVRAALPRTPVSLLWPIATPVPADLSDIGDRRIDYPIPGRSPTAAECHVVLALLEQEAAAGVIAFSEPGHAPYPAAYLCCLAGIPYRAGYASEFAGAIFTHPVAPSATALSPIEHHLHLLEALGLPTALSCPTPSASAIAVPNRAAQ